MGKKRDKYLKSEKGYLLRLRNGITMNLLFKYKLMIKYKLINFKCFLIEDIYFKFKFIFKRVPFNTCHFR